MQTSPDAVQMADRIHPSTRIGTVHLTVSNLERAAHFYRTTLGLTVRGRDDATARLGADGPLAPGSSGATPATRDDLLVLTEVPGARKVHHTTGLYHFAILVPSRLELSRVLRHLIEQRTTLQGLSDHGVSEAIYLADPDGNGIEVYRDRPRTEWPLSDGHLAMTSDPIDVEALVAESKHVPTAWPGMPTGTIMGHIHLHVADLEASQEFYVQTLGFDLMAHYGRSASFVSAGHYHHHIGFNLWAGVGAVPPPEDSVGLRHFEVRLPDDAALADVLARVNRAGLHVRDVPHGVLVYDPSSNGIQLLVG